jgi:chromosome segregation protein
MRLRSLELKGFKSFADKTIINFSEDVIGVVGSNGCGKSNIVDSIRWVLGEQKTKQLRSDSMTNVIFNGTKSRKSAGLAEVTLIFDNDRGVLPTEFQEVSLKRVLYKDGSGEYYLNGVKCRLKDIKDLLSDTGMGPDSYAIIALGMVDDLLQDKDNSRLRLFEQAAGISKYKIRKKETLRKLHQTEEDLARVEDLLYEIEQQVKSLAKQAKRAKKYLEIKADYKQLSIELHTYKIQSLRENYKKVEEQIKTERQALRLLEKKVTELEEKVQSSKNAHIDKEQLLEQAKRKLGKIVSDIKNKENDQKIRSQKTLFIQQNNEKLESRIDNAGLKLAEAEKDIEKYQGQLTTEQSVLEILSNEMTEAYDKLETIRKKHADLKAELDNFLNEQKVMNNRIVDAEKQMAVNNSQQDNLKIQSRQIDERVEGRQTEMQEVLNESKKTETEIHVQEELLKQLKLAEEKRQADLEETEVDLETCTEQLQKENRKLDSKQNEYQLLKSLVENMEGFPESIKFLSKNKEWSEAAPLLSDLFYCPPEYRTAIENYLDAMLSYYVVANVNEAVAAIQLLDQNKKGKANFLLLDKLKKSQQKSAFQSNVGVSALSILEFDEDYQELAEYLLSSVYIVESLEEIPNTKDGIWLTKDGRFTHKGITMHGGSVGAFEGKKIGRKKNLQLLEKEIKELQEKTTQLSKEQAALKEEVMKLRQANKQRDIQRNEQELQKFIQKGISLKAKLDNFEAFKKDAEEQKEQLKQQIKQLRSKNRDLEGDLEYLEDQMELLNERLSAKDSSYKSVAEELSSTSSTYNQKHIEQVRQQNKLGSIEKELNFAKRQFEELKNQLERDKKSLTEGGSELQNVHQEIANVEQELEEMYVHKKGFQEHLAEVEKAYFEARGSIAEVEEQLRQENKQQQRAVELVHQLETQFSEIKAKLSNIGERLQVEFEINLGALMQREPNPDLDPKELESTVEKLRSRINNYGVVNPMAIEAYDEAKERFDFITAQREDLINSKETLMETIAEIDDTATKKFMDAFNEARENFVHVFRSLFMEDDTCDLLLTDPQNPLESRIEIIAKPKGKRPLSINQLSGGEKTLTATALLFSLYLLKPAPFCIFDEVDAPLDDANIAKFNNIIKDFSKNSQFIIVTHNKKTMAAVDIMYGVTMVKGVSKVVPVDFREFEMAE